MDGISDEGRELLTRLGIDGRSTVLFEVLHHDGYDAEGPESDLWDLYVLDAGSATVSAYHRENWFRGDKEPYVFTGTLPATALLARLGPCEKETLARAIAKKKEKQ